MKRFLKLSLLVLALMLALSMVGCKGGESVYYGEWKANSIQSRDNTEIVYTTLTLKLEADGTCNYCGRTGRWELLEEDSAIKLTLADESFNLTVTKEADTVVLKYLIDTFYRAENFIQKDRESVAPPESESAVPGEAELPEILG